MTSRVCVSVCMLRLIVNSPTRATTYLEVVCQKQRRLSIVLSISTTSLAQNLSSTRFPLRVVKSSKIQSQILQSVIFHKLCMSELRCFDIENFRKNLFSFVSSKTITPYHLM